jgi:hypothetical protein
MNIVRVDTSSWIAGRVLVGNAGLGVLASNIPPTGANGASFLYNDITLPGDANKAIRALILTRPSAGTLFVYEDGSFIFSGAPDGTYTFTYQLFVDGVSTGSPTTVTLNIGSGISASGQAVSTCTATLTTGIKLSASAQVVSTCTAVLSAGNSLGSANAISVSTASAALTTSIRLNAVAAAIATASANLTGGSQINPSIRTVIFDGGTNTVSFAGGTNRVAFTF